MLLHCGCVIFQLQSVEKTSTLSTCQDNTTPHDDPATGPSVALSLEEIARYGRQLILPEIGMKGKL